MAGKSDVLAPIAPFVIAREFDAPRDLVWKAWTEAERLVQWTGPKGSTVKYSKMDFRVGGSFHYCLQFGEHEIWGRAYYREIVPPEKLVYINTFSDEKGAITRHPLAPDWPAELRTTVNFTERNGKTTVTLEWIPINAGEAEIKAFEAGRDSMKGGWGGSFEVLADYLKHAQGA